MTSSSGTGCLRVAGIGCAILFVVAILGIGLIAANLDVIRESEWFGEIRETAEGAKQEVGSMVELQRELLELYPAERLSINLQFQPMDGARVKTLAVELINPELEAPEEALEPFAREVAGEVARRYPEIERYDRVLIALSRVVGVGVTVSSARQFPFEVSELIASDDAAPQTTR